MGEPAEMEPVYFRSTDLTGAVRYLRDHAAPGGEPTRAVEVAPVDLSESLLPEVKRRFGRTRTADRPSAQIIFADPATGPAQSTLTVDAEGVAVAEVVAAAGLAAPGAGTIEPTRDGVMVITDVGDDAESLLRFATDAMAALVPGREPRFLARAYDI